MAAEEEVRFRPGHRRSRSYPTEKSPLFSPGVAMNETPSGTSPLVWVSHESTQTPPPSHHPGDNDGGMPVMGDDNRPYELTEEDKKQMRTYMDNIRRCHLSNPLSRFLYRLLRKKRPKTRDGCEIWCVKDCLGMTGAIFTWLLIIVGELVLILFVAEPFLQPTWGLVNGVFSVICASLGFIAHVRSTFSDPGAVIRGNATPENIKKLGLQEGQLVYKCPKCISIKPERAHHCSVCRRCIKKMDHHCPWINNCVGETNQKYFVLFTFYICVISFHAMYMCIHHFIVCLQDDWKMCVRYSPPVTTIFLIFLIFESLLFGIFTAIMCGTQLSAICSDETGIEQLKRENPSWERKGWWLSLTAVFGYPFNILWFSPFHEPFVKGKDEVYQYTV